MNKTGTYLASLPQWQKDFLVTFRTTLHDVSDTIEEDFKWNAPVFLIDGKLAFAMSAFKAHVKYNFIGNGALLSDPNKLFNNGFDSKKARGIDLREGDVVDLAKLQGLVEDSLRLINN